MLQQCPNCDANGIHGEVTPEEGKAEDEANQFDAAKLVNPIGLIKFTEFNGVGNGEADYHQSACGCRAEDQSEHEKYRHRPQPITHIIDVEIR